MRTWKPLMTTATYEVRNAWMGEQLTIVPAEKPLRVMVSERVLRETNVRGQLHRWGYFPVHSEPFFRGTEYARWFVWALIKAEYLARQAFFSVARALYRAGFFHFACDDYVSPRWRDVRLGPRS